MKVIVIRYSEIALKGKNRAWFEKQLILNMNKHLRSLPSFRTRKFFGRIFLEIGESDPEPFLARLKYIPGVANYSLAHLVDHDVEKIREKGYELMEAHLKNRTEKSIRFKVDTTRTYKQFPMNSMQLSAAVGERVVSAFPQLSVDLKHAELALGIEVWPFEKSILFLEKIPAQGGLPVGVSGNVISFLSGGIDSPVSSWMMMKRGCKTIFLYFHSYPFVGEQSQQKTIDLVKQLSRYQPENLLLIASLTEIQKSIKKYCQEKYRTLLYRRLMYHVANEIRKKYKVVAYVTGEAVGQVASQTMTNMHCTGDVVSIPILRPLVGMHKIEIIELSQKIGTYPISIQPFPDCCTVFQPRKPETNGKLEEVNREEAKIPNLQELISQSAEGIEKIEIESQVQDKFWSS